MKNRSAIQKQFQEEVNSWKRILVFLLQENAFLKTRLSEVLQEYDSEVEMLNTAEQFQNSFIRKDEIINLMRNDVNELGELLSNDIHGTIMEEELVQKQQVMRLEMKNIVSTFNKLKFDFNTYLSGNV